MATFYIEQFGCRATQADGQALERQLLDRGSSLAPSPDEADVVVVNTCTVTSAADAQAREAIRRIHRLNPLARVVVTGCYAQRAPEELAGLPGVSWVVGNSHKPQIPDLVGPAPGRDFVPLGALGVRSAGDRAGILRGEISGELLAAPVSGGEGNHTRPTLKIQDGCNLRCSYCVIPLVRGRSRSLAPDTVVREVLRLTAHGAKEVVLSGINLGTYGRDLHPRADFQDTLRRILDETALDRLRISSIEPQDVTGDLVELFHSNGRLAEHFHMPLQSGSDRILAAMHRWYRTEHYARRVEAVRERLPHAAIGADVIAGFPGESEADHRETVRFLERMPFTYLHVFSYSARPGTRAAQLPGQLPTAITRARARELRALGEAKSAAFRRSQAGRTLRVLTLGRSPEEIRRGSTPAISSNYLQIQVAGSVASNEWMDVQVSAGTARVLAGTPAGTRDVPWAGGPETQPVSR